MVHIVCGNTLCPVPSERFKQPRQRLAAFPLHIPLGHTHRPRSRARHGDQLKHGPRRARTVLTREPRRRLASRLGASRRRRATRARRQPIKHILVQRRSRHHSVRSRAGTIANARDAFGEFAEHDVVAAARRTRRRRRFELGHPGERQSTFCTLATRRGRARARESRRGGAGHGRGHDGRVRGLCERTCARAAACAASNVVGCVGWFEK